MEIIKKWASDLGLTNLKAVKADATLLLPRPLGAAEGIGAVGSAGAILDASEMSGGGPDDRPEKEKEGSLDPRPQTTNLKIRCSWRH